MSVLKVKSWRSDEYLEYIRSKPCSITESTQDIVAHHVRCLGGGGVSLKPPDWMCVPLTPTQHSLLHSMPERQFWAAADLDPVQLITLHLLVWLAKHPSDRLMHELGRLVESRGLA